MSALVLVAFYFFLAGVKPTLAAQEEPNLSTAEVAAFVLRVVAVDTNVADLELGDGALGELSAEYLDLPIGDRAALRDSFRPLVQLMLGQADCATFTSLAEEGFVEPTGDNRARYSGCVADDSADTAVAAAPAPQAAPPASSTTASPPVSPTEAYRRASAGLQASHNMYTQMSNVLLENHVSNMNAILTMGDSNYRYVITKP